VEQPARSAPDQSSRLERKTVKERTASLLSSIDEYLICESWTASAKL
jgi:hypothetical protein